MPRQARNKKIQEIIDDVREDLEEVEDLANDLAEDGDDAPAEDPDEGEEDPDEQEPEDPPTSGELPTDVLPELKTWTVMLPTMKPGGDTPKNDYAGKWGAIPNIFFVQNGGVVFRAPANGAHSKNSDYVRTEARQMLPDWEKGAWSSSGSHSLECELSIDASHLTARKRLNGMQIHDGGDDVCQIMRHESLGLGFMHNDGKTFVSIDPDYEDGTRFTCKILAEDDRIKVWYNGALRVDVPKKGSGWYWKTGAYNQSGGASEHKEPDSAYGEVIIYRLVTTGGAS
jgi:hypothetical protein